MLICLDKSPSTHVVLNAARDLISKTSNNADIYVLHMIGETLANSIDEADIELKSALRARSREIERMAENTFLKTITYLEEYGLPNEKITELLKKSDYDLLIVGSHGRTRLKNTLFGSYATTVLSDSPKPVTIARVSLNEKK
ncbi:hypothetical protein CNR22_18450 [Sphingobacteriaceae bacterium]|nr:hypothetical protein CNR22_18450 [Sphingobacteriaceae bacterium]